MEAQTETPLPRYLCHKKVWALKIKSVSREPGHDSANRKLGAMITPENEQYASFFVDGEYMTRNKPEVGGYYVVYDDGYKSYSPAKAFEEGYIPLNGGKSPLDELRDAVHAYLNSGCSDADAEQKLRALMY